MNGRGDQKLNLEKALEDLKTRVLLMTALVDCICEIRAYGVVVWQFGCASQDTARFDSLGM